MSEEINIVGGELVFRNGTVAVTFSGTFGTSKVRGVVSFRTANGGKLFPGGWTHDGPPGFAESGKEHAERSAALVIKSDPEWKSMCIVTSQMLHDRRAAAREAAEAPARKAAEAAAVATNKAAEHATTEAQLAQPKPQGVVRQASPLASPLVPCEDKPTRYFDKDDL